MLLIIERNISVFFTQPCILHLHFFAVFYKKYSDLLQVLFQCKKYSENTAGNGTQRKTVIFTADIFAVQQYLPVGSLLKGNFFMKCSQGPQGLGLAQTLDFNMLL